MIAKLTGKIDEVFEDFIILDVNGIGYRVEFAGILDVETEQISLYIHTHVREQELRLFGFRTSNELDLFEKLLSVSGVGPKAAITLISAIGHDQIISAISNEDPKLLKAPGVGKKTAERIIVDLRNKIDLKPLGTKTGKIISKDQQKIEEVMEALIQLGYKESEVIAVLNEAEISEYESEALLKFILKQLTRDVLR